MDCIVLGFDIVLRPSLIIDGFLGKRAGPRDVRKPSSLRHALHTRITRASHTSPMHFERFE